MVDAERTWVLFDCSFSGDRDMPSLNFTETAHIVWFLIAFGCIHRSQVLFHCIFHVAWVFNIQKYSLLGKTTALGPNLAWCPSCGEIKLLLEHSTSICLHIVYGYFWATKRQLGMTWKAWIIFYLDLHRKKSAESCFKGIKYTDNLTSSYLEVN